VILLEEMTLSAVIDTYWNKVRHSEKDDRNRTNGGKNEAYGKINPLTKILRKNLECYFLSAFVSATSHAHYARSLTCGPMWAPARLSTMVTWQAVAKDPFLDTVSRT
jgi:hypothetical protein